MTLKPFGNTSQAKTIKISSPNPTLAKRLGWGMRFGFIQDSPRLRRELRQQALTDLAQRTVARPEARQWAAGQIKRLCSRCVWVKTVTC